MFDIRKLISSRNPIPQYNMENYIIINTNIRNTVINKSLTTTNVYFKLAQMTITC